MRGTQRCGPGAERSRRPGYREPRTGGEHRPSLPTCVSGSRALSQRHSPPSPPPGFPEDPREPLRSFQKSQRSLPTLPPLLPRPPVQPSLPSRTRGCFWNQTRSSRGHKHLSTRHAGAVDSRGHEHRRLFSVSPGTFHRGLSCPALEASLVFRVTQVPRLLRLPGSALPLCHRVYLHVHRSACFCPPGPGNPLWSDPRGSWAVEDGEANAWLASLGSRVAPVLAAGRV